MSTERDAAARQVLIVGAGVGGLAAAHKLRRLLPAADRVVVFDQSPVHTFWPSLLWVLSGTRKPEQVCRPLAALRTQGITVITKAVTTIDAGARQVGAGGERWSGDAVVLAPGADVDPTLVPGLADEPGNFYTLAGAEAVWDKLRDLEQGRVVVLVSRVPFKCPAAPYEAAMLIDGYLRKRHRRPKVEVEVWAAEAAPMAVAGPAVSQAVIDALTERDIAYHPGEAVSAVDAASHRLVFPGGRDRSYDLLAYVPPHRAPAVVQAAGLGPPGGWVDVNHQTLETSVDNVFAVGDVTGIGLALGKPLPKAGTFAHTEGEAVAQTIAHRLTGKGQPGRFDGVGECFIEMGGSVAGFARGNFYAEPLPTVRAYRSGRHWHAAKVAFERHWWAQWW